MTIVINKIKSRIKRKGRGWVFAPSDFFDLANRDAIDQIFSRLVKQGTIRRLSRGIYDYPKNHKILGTLSPDPANVAMAMSPDRKILISGAMAANMIGFSTQVPAKIVYLNNSVARNCIIGKQTITVKKAKLPIDYKLSDRLNIFLQAIFYLGKTNIDNVIIEHSAKILPDKDLAKLQKSFGTFPYWIVDTINKIVKVKHA